MSLITCRDVSIDYENTHAVENVNMAVENGDYICIVGENGSGKSTLVKALIGLKKVTGGEIEYGEIRSDEIGYLPQQTVVQRDFPATVYEVVLSGCLNSKGWRPFYNADDRKRARSNMEKLGVTDIAKKSYRELSGGQQQRVLLARALCSTKKMLLLDEPMTGLDPVAQNEFYALIEHLNRTHKITVVMISHDIGTALKYASKILHLKTEQLFFGKTEDYFSTDLCKKMVGGQS